MALTRDHANSKTKAFRRTPPKTCNMTSIAPLSELTLCRTLFPGRELPRLVDLLVLFQNLCTKTHCYLFSFPKYYDPSSVHSPAFAFFRACKSPKPLSTPYFAQTTAHSSCLGKKGAAALLVLELLGLLDVDVAEKVCKDPVALREVDEVVLASAFKRPYKIIEYVDPCRTMDLWGCLQFGSGTCSQFIHSR